MPWNHVHNPNFASTTWCNTSKRGPVGDATQELDSAIGKGTVFLFLHFSDENDRFQKEI
eukprot:COSAG06_NODE_4219_length_4465_cov_1.710587_2_plen_59_part_00